MKPVHQTQFAAPAEGEPGDPKTTGNCTAACIASMLELNLADVPNFAVRPEGEWWPWMLQWLTDRGWYAIAFPGHFPYPGYYLVSGNSPRGDFKHLVVYCAGELVHDPHPSGAGIDGEPIDQWLLVPLDPGRWVRQSVPA